MAAGADRRQGLGERHRRRATRLSAYFDTSAFIKLLVAEEGTGPAQAVWRCAASRVASVALLAETRAGLAAARRAGRTTDTQHARAITGLSRLWREMDGIDVTEQLAVRAGELADAHALRGYDAIHLASAEAVLDDGDVMVVSDTRLAEAAASIGIAAVVPAER